MLVLYQRRIGHLPLAVVGHLVEVVYELGKDRLAVECDQLHAVSAYRAIGSTLLQVSGLFLQETGVGA